MAAVARKPDVKIFVLGAFVEYMQIRHVYDRGQFWEPLLAAGGYRPTRAMLDERAASPERLKAFPDTVVGWSRRYQPSWKI